MSIRPPRSVVQSCLTVTMLTLLVGCGATPKGPAPKPTPTPIAQLNTSEMNLPRVKFCDLVPTGAVTAALTAPATASTSWANGDLAPVTAGTDDVAHEFGCRYTAGTATAEAWIFARPVQPGFAEVVIGQAARKRGCTSVAGPQFGQPSQRQTCRLPGGVVRVRFTGLFGQTWLSCQVEDSGSSIAITRRAGAWCVRVVNATNTTR